MKSDALRVAIAAAILLLPAVADAACRTAPGGGPRFAVDGETARDEITGLTWRRCALGAKWDGTTCVGGRAWLGLDAAEAAAAEIGPGWRVPNVEEMWGLLDEGCGRPMVDTSVFADVTPGEGEGDEDYWTTTDAGLGGLWYFVDLAGGIVDGHSRSFSLGVRPVRSGR